MPPRRPWRGTNMWRRLRLLLSRPWRRLQKDRDERRTAEARTRFWDEVREGQREAEAQSQPSRTAVPRGPTQI
jgi:hypothetical protein